MSDLERLSKALDEVPAPAKIHKVRKHLGWSETRIKRAVGEMQRRGEIVVCDNPDEASLGFSAN
jgi:hypothetical protein